MVIRLCVAAALAFLALVAGCAADLGQHSDPGDMHRAALLLFPGVRP